MFHSKYPCDLKIWSRSPKLNHFLPLIQWCSHASMVKTHPFVFQTKLLSKAKTDFELENREKSPKSYRSMSFAYTIYIIHSLIISWVNSTDLMQMGLNSMSPTPKINFISVIPVMYPCKHGQNPRFDSLTYFLSRKRLQTSWTHLTLYKTVCSFISKIMYPNHFAKLNAHLVWFVTAIYHCYFDILLYLVIMIIYLRPVNKYKEGRVWTALRKEMPFNIHVDTKLWLWKLVLFSARPRSAEYTIGICFETAKNTKAFECFLIGFQRALWKFSTTGNLYSLKSRLW